MKKAASFVMIGITALAILFLAYLFITKGYSNKGTSFLPTKTVSPTSDGITPESQETGSVTSTKISLIITSPVNGSTLDSTNVSVKGKTSPNAEVFVNDVTGKADANGNFSVSIGLDEGSNLITVSANDAEGNASQQDLNVTVVSFE